MSDAPTADPRLAHRAYLLLQQLAVHQRDETEQLLRSEQLTLTQLNILRILRGAGTQGLTCGEIGARLINRDPDVTRLLDRLEKQGLVERRRSAQDRRIVLSELSDAGREAVERLDAPLAALHSQQFAHLTEECLQGLVEHLREALGESAVAGGR